MDHNLDPNLQKIIYGKRVHDLQTRDETSRGLNVQNRQEQSFGFPPIEQPDTWNFGPGLRQQHVQDPMLLNDMSRKSYNHEPPRQPMIAPSTGLPRLSLAPRSIYHQQDREPRAMTNADHHFKFAQNLRQGVPMNPTPARVHSNMQMQSPISQLATNMFLQKPMPILAPEPMDYFHGIHQDRHNRVQSGKQQATPPFNLSGFMYSPSAQATTSSSPPLHQNSSPTTRISLRRTSNYPAQSIKYEQDHHETKKYEAPPQTPQRQIMGPTEPIVRKTPHTFSLGHAPPMAHGIQLISPHELPDRFRQVFPYELFNAAQSKCFAPIYKSNDNVVVSAPTGSGKTALLELAICKLVEAHRSGEFKIVYQAPTKSLCSERMRDWTKKFSHLNLPCAELTGDTSQSEMNKVRNASIIVTTPEKWDSITRKWKDYVKLLELVKLFLIDEVHILKDTRGATLEAVVSRMKSIGTNVRFVVLSATVPNSEDIALWLGRDHTNKHIPAHRETFGEDFRPVRLQKHVHGFDGPMNDFAFEKVLDGKLPSLLQKYTHKKPIMVFNFTRKSCEKTAAMLAEWWTRQRVVNRAWPAPTQRTVVGSKELQDLVECGIAFHHAGLDPQDRNAIEMAYLKGDISLICCTSTLAVGINLPCHLVVLKGTVGFSDGLLCEYSDLEVMQMLGRAGRPQFDDSAMAIIMTRSGNVDRYKKMISGQDILESTLHLNLIEHLNSEIGLGTVHNLYKAKDWLSSTFLSVRMRRKNDYYKLDGIPQTLDADERLKLVCERDVKLLQDHQLVTLGDRLNCTEYGLAMSRYMVQFDTMKLLLSLGFQAKTEEILLLLCQASEFKDLRMKPNERPSLRELNKSPFIKYPIKENISTTAHKVSLIIQVQLGGVDLPAEKDFQVIRRQYLVDKSLIFERIQRLIRCIIDCKSVDCDAVSTRHALDLARSLSAEFWENSSLELRQVPQIGPAATRKFATSNVKSVEKLASLDTATIERIMGRNPPFGHKLLNSVAGFPRLTLTAKITDKVRSKTGQNPKVNVAAQMGFSNPKIPVWNGTNPSLTFMAYTSNGTLVHFWRGKIHKLDKGQELRFVVELCGADEEITCYFACDEIVGTLRTCKLQHDLPASAFPVPKPRQQIQPVGETKKNSNSDDEFGADEFEDAELLAAVKDIEEPANGYVSEEFIDIDDFDDSLKVGSSMKSTTEGLESYQLENGKWACNHRCRDGLTLKNGQPCKHKCCKEGLDKPRKVKKKSQTVVSNPQNAGNSLGTKGKKTINGFPNQQRKLTKTGRSDPDDVEIINLAEELPTVPYSELAPRDYRKLHNLHTKVQPDKSVRLLMQKPQFSYASGKEAKLPFLHKSKSMDDPFVSDDDDFPSPEELLKSINDSPDQFSPAMVVHEDRNLVSSTQDDSLASLEEAMVSLADSAILKKVPNSNMNSCFTNRVFDFDAFPAKQNEQDIYSSPLMRESYKRARSPSPKSPMIKRRHVTKDTIEQQVLAKENDTTQLATPAKQEDSKPASSQLSPPGPEPSWVAEMEENEASEIIGFLRGCVKFV